jgi:ribonuclease HI
MKPHGKTPPPRSARLFSEPHSAPPAGVHLAYVDGASRGNPGPASYAAIVRAPDGKTIFEMGKRLGIATNNAAEYHGLITALDYAAHHGIKSLRVRSDSELLVNQMNGRYRVRSKDLKPLHERAAKIANHLEYFAIEHVPREENRDADALANDALDHSGDRPPFFSGKLLTADDLESEQQNARKKRTEDRKTRPEDRAAPPFHASHRKPEVCVVKARYKNGVLVPAEPLDLTEGAEVEIEFRKSRHS